MPSYIGPDDDPTDPDDLAGAAFDSLVEYIDGYIPDDNSLESWLIVVLSRIAATNADVAKQMPLAAFRYFGQTIVGLQPRDGLSATVNLTFTAQNNAGYTIPDGTYVAYQVSGDTLVPFQTVGDVVIAPGFNTTPTGGVPAIAVDQGSSGNGLSSDDLILLDALTWVTSVTATGVTSGGVDGETDEAYIQRLSAEIQLYTPTPILPDNFATMARSVPGVTRATAVSGYNPSDSSTNNERMVAVCVVDGTGAALSTAVKTAVKNYLQSLREINFIVNVFDPHYTTVNVVFTFTLFAGYDPTQVQTAAVGAVSAFLNPATWGVEPDDVLGVTWQDTNKIYRSSLIAALLAVPGIRWVNTLTVNNSSADTVTLAGPGSLPQVGTITGSVATS